MANGSHERNLAQSETLCTWRRSLTEPGRSHPCPEVVLDRLGKATSRTPSVYVDEKSDEAIVLMKRSNKGRQLPAEVVEGRASPKGNSRQTAVVRTQSRVATSIRLAAVRQIAGGYNPRAADV
jgi:hypothetical protein